MVGIARQRRTRDDIYGTELSDPWTRVSRLRSVAIRGIRSRLGLGWRDRLSRCAGSHASLGMPDVPPGTRFVPPISMRRDHDRCKGTWTALRTRTGGHDDAKRTRDVDRSGGYPEDPGRAGAACYGGFRNRV